MTNENIEHLLGLAAASKSNDDYLELFSNLMGVELFFTIVKREESSPIASTHNQSSRTMEVPLRSVGEGLRAVVFYSSKDSPLLQKPFAGIPWEYALKMVKDIPKADGLVLQGFKPEAWIAIDRNMIKRLTEAMESVTK